MGNSGNDRKSRVGTRYEGVNSKWMKPKSRLNFSGSPQILRGQVKIIKTALSSEGRQFVKQVGESYHSLEKNAPTGNNPNPHKFTKNEYWARREGLDNWAEQGGKWRTGKAKKGGVVKK